jgi:GTP cyclohydrolase IA
MTLSLPQHYREILKGLGEDPEREGLLDTPKRAAKAMQYLCHGYEQNLDDIVNGALFTSDNDEMVILKDIELYSLCEHHLLPFIGKAHVAYIPTGKVLGLSKLARIVDMYARRLQIQENLTRQIADAIQEVTQAAGVAVVIEAKHMCMMMRGVEKQNSTMNTSVMLGAFRESNTYIGINEDEILNKQDVLINLTILYAAQEAVRDNDIDHALNYRTITKAIIAHVEGNRFALLERLTQELLDLVMSNETVLYAEVEVDKPHALRFAESVSITLAASR